MCVCVCVCVCLASGRVHVTVCLHVCVCVGIPFSPTFRNTGTLGQTARGHSGEERKPAAAQLTEKKQQQRSRSASVNQATHAHTHTHTALAHLQVLKRVLLLALLYDFVWMLTCVLFLSIKLYFGGRLTSPGCSNRRSAVQPRQASHDLAPFCRRTVCHQAHVLLRRKAESF